MKLEKTTKMCEFSLFLLTQVNSLLKRVSGAVLSLPRYCSLHSRFAIPLGCSPWIEELGSSPVGVWKTPLGLSLPLLGSDPSSRCWMGTQAFVGKRVPWWELTAAVNHSWWAHRQSLARFPLFGNKHKRDPSPKSSKAVWHCHFTPKNLVALRSRRTKRRALILALGQL